MFKIFFQLGVLLGLGIGQFAQAESVNVPIFARYDMIRYLMQQQLFKGNDGQAEYPVDKSGCTLVSFKNPQVNGVDGLLKLQADVKIRFGLPGANRCTTLNEWSGGAILKGEPIITGANAQTVQFKAVDAQVLDPSGAVMKGGLIQQALKSRLNPLLDQFKLDLQPSIARAEKLLPTALNGYPTAKLQEVMHNSRLGAIRAEAEGLAIAVQVPMVATVLPKDVQSNSALPSEAQGWDIFLSSIVKQLGARTRSQETKEALLEVLQDARRQYQGRGQDNSEAVFQKIFVSSWERMTPVARELAGNSAPVDLVQMLAYIPAEDVLNTIRGLGKALGVSFTGQGLQNLVQALNHSGS